MIFITTVIALIIERFLHWGHLRYWQWFFRYLHAINLRTERWPTPLVLLACILPLILVVGMIQFLIGGQFYGIPQIIFGVIVLVYCLGPDNLWVDTYKCLNGQNLENAQDCAHAAFGVPKQAESSQHFHQLFTRSIFVEAHQRIFAVLFWFVFLGPLGAVLYRSISLCAKRHELGLSAAAELWRRILDWIPSRLFTFIFALGGHFTEVFNLWKRDAKKGIYENEKLLGECGMAALDFKRLDQLPEDGSAEKAALELLDRVLVIGLVVLALIVLLV